MLEDDAAYTRVRLQCHFDNFGFSVRVGTEIGNSWIGSSQCHIIFAVADHGSYGETFYVGRSFFSVAVGYVVDCTFIVLLEYIDIKNVLTDKFLIGNGGDDIFTITEEDNDIVDIRTAGYELIFLQGRSDKSFFTVDIEFLVCFYYFGCFDGVEVSQFRVAREILAVFVLQHLIPVDGIIHDVSQVVINLGNFLFHLGDQFICFVWVEFQDTPHFDFHQLENIFFRNFTDKCRIVRCQTFVDMCTGCIHVFGLLELFILIDAFFDKYLFERREMQGFQNFSFLDFQLLLQQIHRIVCRLFQDFAHSEEMWLTVIDNTAVGRDTYFTVSESVQSINRFICWGAGCEVH